MFERQATMIKIRVDECELEVEAGKNLLQACLQNGIYIPSLCYLDGIDPMAASCRMCWVEIEGTHQPVAACTVAVQAGMVVKTDTPAVRRLQKTALRFLLSVHDVDCRNCPANRQCELQRSARFLKVGLKSKHLPSYLKQPAIVPLFPGLEYYPNRCILCGKCLAVCREPQGRPVLTFAQRGFDTVVSYFGPPDSNAQACEDCQACARICPVAALIFKVPRGDP
ncbi:MAG: (2Fe-2S)-binding protein [Desulfobacterales bacterium]|nr:MAG: (2Fe-2S)-binding protein [Desulfobacterales bacterium]